LIQGLRSRAHSHLSRKPSEMERQRGSRGESCKRRYWFQGRRIPESPIQCAYGSIRGDKKSLPLPCAHVLDHSGQIFKLVSRLLVILETIVLWVAVGRDRKSADIARCSNAKRRLPLELATVERPAHDSAADPRRPWLPTPCPSCTSSKLESSCQILVARVSMLRGSDPMRSRFEF
jgi:hypothetical protein